MGKFYDAIIGFVVGDALGVPFEFCKRDTFKATDMIGYGTYNQQPGTWSDDSSLTLATIESMVRTGRIDPDDIMHNFYKWYFFGEFTPYGQVFDVGNTTKMAIQRYRYEGVKPLHCGGTDVRDNGNGSLMRILPLAFTGCGIRKVYAVSDLTHAHCISEIACGIYYNIAKALIEGYSKHDAVKWACSVSGGVPAEFERIECMNMIPVDRSDIKSTGYVIDTLEAALWCFLTTDSFKDCVLTAVNLGDDTDTVAAISGGLAGIYYGIGGDKGIPEEWISQIARKEWIKYLCDEFEGKFQTK